MKKVIIPILMFLAGWLIAVATICLKDGIYNGSEAELRDKISCLEVVYPEYGSNYDKWMHGYGSCNTASIFVTSFTMRPFFKYCFLEGKFIPKKYNHIIEEKMNTNQPTGANTQQ